MLLSEIIEFLRMRPPATNQQVPINSGKENHSPTRKQHVEEQEKKNERHERQRKF
jgi:hypothetical protein